jgi:hypothetical protein
MPSGDFRARRTTTCGPARPKQLEQAHRLSRGPYVAARILGTTRRAPAHRAVYGTAPRAASPLTVRGLVRHSQPVTQRRQRPAECAFVRELTQVAYVDDATDISTPDGGWDLVFMRWSRDLQVLYDHQHRELAGAPGRDALNSHCRDAVSIPR